MEKILKNELGLGRKGRIGGIILIAVFFILSISVFFILNRKISYLVRKDVENNISSTSQRNANDIYEALEERRTLLKTMSELLVKSPAHDYKTIANTLKVYADNYQFYDMGVLTFDGIIYTTTEKVINVRDIYPYNEAIKGEPIISESFEAADGSGVKLNTLSMPVIIDGETSYILIGNYRTRELAENLNVSIINGNGYNFIINSQGKAMIYPVRGKDEEYLDLIDYINDNTDIIPQEKKKGKFSFSYHKKEYYAQCKELGINNWYVMSCIQKKHAFSGANVILLNVFMGMGALWLLIFIALCILLLMYIAYQRKMHTIVFTDPLLNEKNYEYLRACFPHIYEQNRKNIAFLVLDVDKFKAYNFAYGSKNGDKLIRYIDQVFKSEIPEGRLYRHVSDQFVGILLCQSVEEAKNRIQMLLRRINLDIEDKVIYPFVLSIGICMLDGYEEMNEVYSDAMIAKNSVKNSHMKQCAVYDEKMRKKSIHNMEMEAGFKEALRNNEFKVYYQPKYDMRTGAIIGAEALVRWVKEDGTIVSPGAFIPCYEETGQIVQLDEAMLQMVCRQMKLMELEGLQPPMVSVNFSRVHLMRPGITKRIRHILENLEVNPSLLAFEITESALYDDGISLTEIVAELHSLGCQVDMDDYGTGISSLNSLANIEFDVIKLDKSFIDKIGDKKMESVIRSTITLSKGLGIRLVAEGVETKEQVDSLVEWGCYYAQGFYYSRPVPEAEYKELLRRDTEKQ